MVVFERSTNARTERKSFGKTLVVTRDQTDLFQADRVTDPTHG
jgi:hypothetical protein